MGYVRCIWCILQGGVAVCLLEIAFGNLKPSSINSLESCLGDRKALPIPGKLLVPAPSPRVWTPRP